MTQPPAARFVRLARVGNPARAQILAARLAAEGIEVRIHSQAYGPYPVTVGQMAVAELWVLDDRVDEASRILMDAELNDVLSPVESGHPPTPPTSLGWQFRLGAAAVGVVVAVLFALRLIEVF
jgi:hypothetical protein